MSGQVPEYAIFNDFSGKALDVAKAFSNLSGTFTWAVGTYTIAGQTFTVSDATRSWNPRDRHTWVLVQLECGHSAWRITDYPVRNEPVERDLTGLCASCLFEIKALDGSLAWTDMLYQIGYDSDEGRQTWMAWKVELPP